MFILLGAVKAAQVLRDQVKKDEQRNGVIMPIEANGNPRVDAYVARHGTDWWESNSSSDSSRRKSSTKETSSAGASASKNPHSVGAWARKSTHELSAELSSSDAPSKSTSVSSTSSSSTADVGVSRRRGELLVKEGNNPLPMVTDFSDLVSNDSKSDSHARAKLHARAKSTPPLEVTQTSPYSTPPGSPSPSTSETCHFPPSESTPQVPSHMAGSFDAAFCLPVGKTSAAAHKPSVPLAPNAERKPPLPSASSTDVGAIYRGSTAGAKQEPAASFPQQPIRHFDTSSAFSAAGTHKRPPRPSAKPSSAITPATDIAAATNKAATRAKESSASLPDQSSSAMTSSSAMLVPGTCKRPVKPGFRRSENPNISDADARASSTPALPQASCLYAEGTMRRQIRNSRPQVPPPSPKTSVDLGLTSESLLAPPSRSCLAAPGSLKKRPYNRPPQ